MTNDSVLLDSSYISSAPVAVAEEKRGESRHACDDPAEFLVVGTWGPRRHARVLDVSRSGMRLKTPTPLNKGAELEIIVGERVAVFGEVRYCRQLAECYHVGILIHDIVFSRRVAMRHVAGEQLKRYLGGKQLAFEEIIHIYEHLLQCEACRVQSLPDESGRQ